jgi:hypothetical protein
VNGTRLDSPSSMRSVRNTLGVGKTLSRLIPRAP